MGEAERTIVVLDDDNSVIRFIRRILTILCKEDVRVVVGGSRIALDGSLATVALLITDGNLGHGELSGPAIIRDVRTKLPTLPCLLHSSDGYHLQAVTPDSITGVLEKPAKLDDFQREIGRVAPHLLKEPSRQTT